MQNQLSFYKPGIKVEKLKFLKDKIDTIAYIKSSRNISSKMCSRPPWRKF